MDLQTITKTIPVVMIGYVLKLEGGNFYCGVSTNVNQRIAQHMIGEGSRWTKLHKPVSVVLLEACGSEFGKWEKKTTLEKMREYGWKNVRGGPYCKVDMRNPPIDLYKTEGE